MKTKLPITLLLLVCLFIQPVNGAQTSFGGADCGQWLKQKAPSDKAWLLGFMTGFNAMYAIQKDTDEDPLRNINSAEQIFVWMDNYCQKNPLEKVGMGGLKLFIELMLKPK